MNVPRVNIVNVMCVTKTIGQMCNLHSYNIVKMFNLHKCNLVEIIIIFLFDVMPSQQMKFIH
jgi:hypothetical protein